MTRLNLDDGAKAKAGRVNFADAKVSVGRIVALAVGIAGWLWAGIGASSGAVAKDYVNVRDRVTVLEAQRVEDVKSHERQREDDQKWRARIEEKLDRLVEWSVRQVK